MVYHGCSTNGELTECVNDNGQMPTVPYRGHMDRGADGGHTYTSIGASHMVLSASGRQTVPQNDIGQTAHSAGGVQTRRDPGNIYAVYWSGN